MKILFNMTQKHIETKINMRKTCTQTPKKGKFPIGVANFIQRKTSYGFGGPHETVWHQKSIHYQVW